jgi:hypothetical protein
MVNPMCIEKNYLLHVATHNHFPSLFYNESMTIVKKQIKYLYENTFFWTRLEILPSNLHCIINQEHKRNVKNEYGKGSN